MILAEGMSRGDRASPARGRLIRRVLWAILGIGVILEVLLLFRASALTAVSSDTVENVLEASDILRGNVLLHGWVLAQDNFYLSDNPFYLLTRLAFGRSLTAIYAAPFLIYLTFLAASVGIVCRQTRPGRARVVALAALLFYLGTPTDGRIRATLLVGGQHIAVLAFCALAWLALNAADAAATRRGARTLGALYAACALIAMASDPLAIALFFIPTVVGLLLALMRSDKRARSAWLLGTTVLALLGAVLLLDGIRLAGGFTTVKNAFLVFISAEQVGRNASGILFGLLKLSGAYFFGTTLGQPASLIALVRLVGLVFLLAAMIGALKRGLSRVEGWSVRFVLALAVAIDLVSALTSREFASALVPTVWNGGAAIRYLTPTILFGGILAALEFPGALGRVRTPEWRLVWHAVCGLGVVAVVAMFAVLGFVERNQRAAVAEEPGRIAGKWLLQRGLTHGVGDYWEGLLITALTGEHVQVRAVLAQNGRLEPLFWITKRAWYQNQPPPQFVIYAPGNQFGVNAQTITATYGRPKAIVAVAGYDVALLPVAGSTDRQLH